jgi:hypothetical protein
MNYIGNYKNWIIKNNIIKMLDSKKGEKTPVWQPDRWTGNKTLEKFRELARPGYSNNKFFFHQLNASSPEMKGYDFVYPELPCTREHRFWWFVKLYPGEFQSMHVDPHLTELKNFVRYTMFLQNWEPGHIFAYDDKMLSNYIAGDLYEWSNPECIHGPANIGYIPRLTLQITLHD